MLYALLYPLRDLWFGFNVFKYITFRAIGASIMSFLFCVVLGPLFIRWLRALKVQERVLREDAPTIHQYFEGKSGTPTMGGLLILCAVGSATIVWARLNEPILCALTGMLWLGAIGFADDYIKLVVKKKRGIAAATKLAGQLLFGVGFGLYLYYVMPDFPTYIEIPFVKHTLLYLGAWYVLLVVLVVVGASNAVNLTDGLDGLAIGTALILLIPYGIMSYIAGNIEFSNYLNVAYIPGTGELFVLCGALMGGGLGFLWFNAHPASVFMGDTGSLPLGGIIGIIAVLIKKELLLVLAAGVFVFEALSVMIQVVSFKTTGRRVFKCSPFHHHLQMSGWKESKITIRLWIVAVILALATIGTLKLR